jgi:tryptophanyl-tRNA synthetase
MENLAKPVVLTCAQPTGNLHFGNYIGAIRNWVALQQTHTCYFGIVNLHAMTLPYTPSALRACTLECVAQYLACGIDPERAHIFVQSQVIGHTELAWILACITPIGQLERMTQFKDKAQKAQLETESVNAGLLYYPILMAADILLYNADCVPVGADQKQHLELARDLAHKFNQRYSDTFTLPEPYIVEKGNRIFSLTNPKAKMSKSDANANGVLFLFEPLTTIRKKIMSATTDSDSVVKVDEAKPGVSNLLTILHSITNQPIAVLEEHFQHAGYAPFKAAIADAVISFLEPIQKRYQELIKDKTYLEAILQSGQKAAQSRAYKMLSKVYRKSGLL